MPGGGTFHATDGLVAFKEAFKKWHEGLHPGDWQRNRDYMKAEADRVADRLKG